MMEIESYSTKLESGCSRYWIRITGSDDQLTAIKNYISNAQGVIGVAWRPDCLYMRVYTDTIHNREKIIHHILSELDIEQND